MNNQGNLILTKNKLKILNRFCDENNFKFIAPNLDYQNIPAVIEELTLLKKKLDAAGYDVTFIGTSLGGFFAEYMAMELVFSKAILINPAINPSNSLKRYVGNIQNYANGHEYSWIQENCEAFVKYEKELLKVPSDTPRTVLIDLGDEVIDVERTIKKYKDKTSLHTFEGGSHSFDHIEEALPIIKFAIYNLALPLTD